MKRLTLIQQNDTHGHISPHWELRWRNGEAEVWRAGGYAHIRAHSDRIRTECGGACIHVDCGDAIHGTGPAQWTKGAAVVPALNAAGVELMTPGNWEFGFGPEVLRKRREELNFPMIAANVRQAESGEAEFAATEIREAGGLRVAFIGITSPIVGTTMPHPFGAGLRFLDPLEPLQGTVNAVRERDRPDLIVLLSHYGFAQEVALARRVDGLDVILGGHTHDVLADPVIVGRTIITQSGAHGSYLTRLDLEIQNQRICDFRHQLIAVEEDGESSADVREIVEEALRPHRERTEEHAGYTATLLHRGTVLESPMDNLITQAYLFSTGADVSLSHGWRYGTPVPAGPMTAGDLWQMIPTNPEIFTVQLSGKELKSILETSLERTFSGNSLRQQGGYVLRFSGMRAVARLNNPAGSRVQRLEICGRIAEPGREYTVAAAGEQSLPHAKSRVMTGVLAISAIRDYLAQHTPVNAALTHQSLVAI